MASFTVRRLVFLGSMGVTATVFCQSAVAQTRDVKPYDQETLKRIEKAIPSIVDALNSTSIDAQKSALGMLTDLPPTMVAQRNLAPQIKKIVETNATNPEVVRLGFRAFGASYPTPAMANDLFKKFADSTDPEIQAGLVDAANNLLVFSTPGIRSLRTIGAYANYSAIALPVLSKALGYNDPITRSIALGGYNHIGVTLKEIFSKEANPFRDQLPKEEPADERWKNIEPLLTALKTELPKLGKGLDDSDARIRLITAQTIETFAIARKNSGYTNKDYGYDSFKPLIAKLTTILKDNDPNIRLAALDAIEPLGNEAITPEVVADLINDSDTRVRWSAVRSVGRLATSTREEKVLVPIISKLASITNDPDVDLRTAALTSLQKIGPAATTASDAVLQAAAKGDVEVRIVAVKTLTMIKVNSDAAVQVLVPALKEDVRLARSAAVALGQFGPSAKNAVPGLREATKSDDLELRLAAGEALLKIEAPSKARDF